ncbi:hypothetical protein AAVH_31920 [Aphelenchoides avenae]|nr:hypothetical protein AAVH_31920 [Aphelenchus avenae]
MVLGDIEASTDVASVERCAAFGFERKCAAIVYTSLSRNCDCLARITGYTDAADSQVSYFWYDFRQEMCLAKEQQHGIIRDIVYGDNDCPPGFMHNPFEGRCWIGKKSESECRKYGRWFVQYPAFGGVCSIADNPAGRRTPWGWRN